MTDIQRLIEEQARLKEASRQAYFAYEAAKEAYAAGTKALTEALIAEKGWHVGQVIKLAGTNSEARINFIRLNDSGYLTAVCSTRTKTGTWSKSGRLAVSLRRPEGA